MTGSIDDPETGGGLKPRHRQKSRPGSGSGEPGYVRRHGPRAVQSRARPRRNPDRDPDPTLPPAGAIAMPIPPLQSLPDAVGDDRLLPGSILQLPRKLAAFGPAFFEKELPALNMSASTGALTAMEFVARIRSGLSSADLAAVRRLGPKMDERQRAWTLTALGIIASSLVRHVRRESGDRETSAGLDLIPGLEHALLAFGKLTGRVPRESADGIWESETLFSYTGTEGEKRFGEAVRAVEPMLGKAVTLVEPVRRGVVSLGEAAGDIERAADLVARYVAVQADLARRPFPCDFIRMRDFLAPFVVGGRSRQGPNATNSAAWTSLDLAVGLLGRPYRRIARGRTRFMAPADRAKVEVALELPSLCDLLAEAIGYTRTGFSRVRPANLLRRLAGTPPETRRAALAIAKLAHEVARLGAVHVGAIRRNLVDPASKMDAEEQALHPAPVGGGVGGRVLQHTYELRERRLKHPLKAIHGAKELLL